jgi:UDP:flavonoid glycosyltransferase YjiC (YdhE family)
MSMSEFTTLRQSFLLRFYNTFILPLRIFPKIKPQFDKLNELKRNAGATNLPPFQQSTKHALKIVSSVFGLDPARPVGPLVELVGPILSRTYPDLDPELAEFLNGHKRVAYVAFGQHAMPDAHDIALLSTALVAQLEKGNLDGILWSGRHAVPTDKRIRVTRWSPQMAVLLHPSTRVFVTHGGSNSLVEALYAGKRLLFFPFFGDQLGNEDQKEKSRGLN